MKFDINSVNELSENELESVYGGWGNDNGSSSAAAAVAGASGYNSSEHVHSFALLCDISVYSITLTVTSIANIASPTNQCCFNIN